jgi:hypothetical protein
VGKYLAKPLPSVPLKRNLDFGEITQQPNNATANVRKKQKTNYGDFSQFG